MDWQYAVSSRYLDEGTGEWGRWSEPLTTQSRESAVHQAEVLNHRSLISEHRVVRRPSPTPWEVDETYEPTVVRGGDPTWWPART